MRCEKKLKFDIVCREAYPIYTYRGEREHMEFGTNGVKGNLIMGNYSNVHENTHTHRIISITTIFGLVIHYPSMALAAIIMAK